MLPQQLRFMDSDEITEAGRCARVVGTPGCFDPNERLRVRVGKRPRKNGLPDGDDRLARAGSKGKDGTRQDRATTGSGEDPTRHG